ncbi:MAG: hypothetical protein ABWY35_07690 [Pseudorhodoplanes sp.]
MTALIVIVWGLIGSVAGSMLMTEAGPLFGIRHMEGQSAIFGVFVGGPVGAVAGGAIGFGLARRYANRQRARLLLLGGPLALSLAFGLGVYLLETWRTHDHLTTRPNTWGLSFEVRLPAGMPTPAGEKVGIELRSPKEDLTCPVYEYPHGLRQTGDHFVISGQCPLFYATPQRSILVRIGDKPTLIFQAKVKAWPEAATFSDWFPVDEIYDNATGQKRPPRPDENYEIRFGAR